MKIYTKESLIARFKEISEEGWIENRRFGNDGGIGNTLEDLLGIEENNLPIPNAAEWELKTQRLKTSSLTTLFHIEPSPRAMNSRDQIESSGLSISMSAPAFAATMIHSAEAKAAPMSVSELVSKGHADSGIIPPSPPSPNIKTIINSILTMIVKPPKEVRPAPQGVLLPSMSADALIIPP